MNHVKYLGSMITNGARCAPAIKFRIAQQKAEHLFNSKLDLNLRKKLVKCYI
jgi:hypothetical protein